MGAQTPCGCLLPPAPKLKLDLEGVAAEALGLGLTSTNGEVWGRLEHKHQVRCSIDGLSSCSRGHPIAYVVARAGCWR